MMIYVISKHDTESTHLHAAYTDESKAKAEVDELNGQERMKAEIYNEWVVNGDILIDSDGNEITPEWGDYTFTYGEIELIGCEK